MSMWTNVIQYVKKGLKNKTETTSYYKHLQKSNRRVWTELGSHTCGHPCPLSVVSRSCRCAYDMFDWSAFPPCPIRTVVFSCEELLDWHGYPLASPLTVHTHYLLPQTDFKRRRHSSLTFRQPRSRGLFEEQDRIIELLFSHKTMSKPDSYYSYL